MHDSDHGSPTGEGSVKAFLKHALKLFHEADPEDRYAEFYTNIDLANGVLQLHEKDPGYRSAIIKALRSE